MFLFSGRGYWQELVESLLWVHVKLQLVPSLQPRALSITIGRAVGVIHFLAGGIGVSWAFTVCRLLQQIAEMLKCAIEAVFMVPSVGLGWHQLGSHGTWHHMSVGEGTFFTATTAGHIVHVG